MPELETWYFRLKEVKTPVNGVLQVDSESLVEVVSLQIYISRWENSQIYTSLIEFSDDVQRNITEA
jgi:hypothetical protein